MFGLLLRPFQKKPQAHVGPHHAARPAAHAPAQQRASGEYDRSTGNRTPSKAVWERRLQTELARWRENAGCVSHAPDAVLLVDALAGASTESIRQLPAAAREALAFCDDVELPRATLVQYIEKDPTLVQSLLRTANSAAIGGGMQHVIRLDHALERLGLDLTRAVILANCVEGLLSRPGAPYDQMASQIWSHMIRTGQIARSVAGFLDADREEAFATAVLHDVGKLIVFDQLCALRVKFRRSLHVPAPLLGSLLQAVHEPFGALAAFQWNMGAKAASAIGTHHRADPHGVASALSEVIFVAERADHAVRRGETLDLKAYWASGHLSGDRESVDFTLQQLGVITA